eukprot:GHVN01078000.1.p1 GENE.GHVN01078000.1~~GHVN01078000.1.p1  ORF type:complete len:904 (-),score=86.39 GHVN01078000.1:625-3336(-)
MVVDSENVASSSHGGDLVIDRELAESDRLTRLQVYGKVGPIQELRITPEAEIMMPEEIFGIILASAPHLKSLKIDTLPEEEVGSYTGEISVFAMKPTRWETLCQRRSRHVQPLNVTTTPNKPDTDNQPSRSSMNQPCAACLFMPNLETVEITGRHALCWLNALQNLYCPSVKYLTLGTLFFQIDGNRPHEMWYRHHFEVATRSLCSFILPMTASLETVQLYAPDDNVVREPMDLLYSVLFELLCSSAAHLKQIRFHTSYQQHHHAPQHGPLPTTPLVLVRSMEQILEVSHPTVVEGVRNESDDSSVEAARAGTAGCLSDMFTAAHFCAQFTETLHDSKAGFSTIIDVTTPMTITDPAVVPHFVRQGDSSLRLSGSTLRQTLDRVGSRIVNRLLKGRYSEENEPKIEQDSAAVWDNFQPAFTFTAHSAVDVNTTPLLKLESDTRAAVEKGFPLHGVPSTFQQHGGVQSPSTRATSSSENEQGRSLHVGPIASLKIMGSSLAWTWDPSQTVALNSLSPTSLLRTLSTFPECALDPPTFVASTSSRDDDYENRHYSDHERIDRFLVQVLRRAAVHIEHLIVNAHRGRDVVFAMDQMRLPKLKRLTLLHWKIDHFNHRLALSNMKPGPSTVHIALGVDRPLIVDSPGNDGVGIRVQSGENIFRVLAAELQHFKVASLTIHPPLHPRDLNALWKSSFPVTSIRLSNNLAATMLARVLASIGCRDVVTFDFATRALENAQPNAAPQGITVTIEETVKAHSFNRYAAGALRYICAAVQERFVDVSRVSLVYTWQLAYQSPDPRITTELIIVLVELYTEFVRLNEICERCREISISFELHSPTKSHHDFLKGTITKAYELLPSRLSSAGLRLKDSKWESVDAGQHFDASNGTDVIHSERGVFLFVKVPNCG